ncbi:MAG: putative lipoprotein [Parcubacteria group bacterium]|nr:putative lipoprotein [Parcubacteria group bacterium]
MESENINQTNVTAKRSGNKKFILIVIALLIVGGAVSYFLPGNLNVWSKLGISSVGNTAAVINGDKITLSDLDLRIDQAKEAIQLQGVNLADEKALAEVKKQMLADMINEKIVLQNAAKGGITVTDTEVQTAYNEVVSKFKSKEEFEKELTTRNLTEAGIKENISRQMTLNKYIEQNVDAKSISVTDEEINNLYKSYSAQQANMPKLEEIKTQLSDQVKQQKYKALVLEFVDKLKKESKIEINL